jgi:hypothetical protein
MKEKRVSRILHMSSVSIATRQGAWKVRYDRALPVIPLLSTGSRPALSSTKSLIQWLLGSHSSGVK